MTLESETSHPTTVPQVADAISISSLDPLRLARAKASYAIRRVALHEAKGLIVGGVSPRSGDVVLARIERLGQHSRIELGCGRRAALHVGDEVVLCFGGRYAPDQFEAVVPDDLGTCDMVAAGGIAARCVERHGRMKRPTRIQPLGILAHRHGAPVNVADFALDPVSPASRPAATYVVCGSMMNAGKTTMAAHLVRGLKGRGLSVGAAKVTGTGAGGDRWALEDAGADRVVDFTDCGVPSTYGLSETRVEALFEQIVGHLVHAGAEALVLEIADGIYQRETRFLLESAAVRNAVDGVFFAAADALSSVAGVAILRALGYPIVAVGGAMTASPLAIREAEGAIDLPVLTSDALAAGRDVPEITSAAEMSPSADGEGISGSPFVKWVSAEPAMRAVG